MAVHDARRGGERAPLPHRGLSTSARAPAPIVIDLHTHVLPGVDDGPPKMGGSVALAEVAAHGGTRTLVATPHVRSDHPRVRPEQLAQRAREVDEALRERRIAVRVLPGAELDLHAAEELSDADLRLSTLGGAGRHLLVETPYGPLPDDFEERLEALAARGFDIVLAHPERNRTLQDDPGRLGELAEEALVQLTAGSLVEGRSRPAALAVRALREGWASVMASDAHSATWRPPNLNVGAMAARQALPEAEEEIEWMVEDAPRAIVEGRDPPARPVREEIRRPLFRLGRRR
jgi:protein-tyrosine phosphatase